MLEKYRQKLTAIGLSDQFIDECLHLFQQQTRNFSGDMFVNYAIRQHRKQKQSSAEREKKPNTNEPLPLTEDYLSQLNSDWVPEENTLHSLQNKGFSLPAIYEQLPDFIYYYNNRIEKNTRYTVDMQFAYHVQRQLELNEEKNLQAIERYMEHTPKMQHGWWPGDEVFSILHSHYGLPKVVAEGYVDEFVLYWIDRNTVPKSKSWRTAFIQHAVHKYEKEQKQWSNRHSYKKTSSTKNKVKILTD